MENYKQTLLSNFETIFNEFKDYGRFYATFLKDFREKQKDFQQWLAENHEDGEIEDKIFENQSLPMFYAGDLDRLKERTITTYEAIRDVVEIPEKVAQEMKEIIKKKNSIFFKIENNEPILVEKELLEQRKELAREKYRDIVKG